MNASDSVYVTPFICDGIDYFRWENGKGDFRESPINYFIWRKKKWKELM